MAEIGWPLIPREVLPAPVRPAARGRRPQRATPHEAGRQLSIFGAETTEPSPLDLAGLLAGPGRIDRMGGTARVAVTVDSAWRVHVLVAELVSRGLVVHWRPVQDQGHDEVRRVPSTPEPGVYPHTGGDPVPTTTAPAPATGRPTATPPRAGRPPRPYRPDDMNASVDADLDPADLVADDDVPPPDFTADLDDFGVIGAGARAGRDAAPAHAPDDARVAGGARAGRNAATGGAHDAEAPGAPASAGDPDAPPGADQAAEVEGDVSHHEGRGPGHVLFEVRTAYSSRLNGLARAWPASADQLFLGGPRLRLWVAAAGRPVDGGYVLGLGVHDPATWPGVDAALRRAGLDGELSDLGLDYLITGRKRLDRLAELVGDRPGAAPAEFWPGGAAA